MSAPVAITVPRLRRLALVHLAALLGAAVLVFLAALRLPGTAWGTALFVVGVLAAFDLALWAYLRGSVSINLSDTTITVLTHGQVVLDLAGLTLLLHFVGGAESPFFPFYVFPIIVAGALLSRLATFGYAGFATLCYVGLLAAESFGWVSHNHLAGLHDPLYYQAGLLLFAQALALGATCLVVAEATTALVGALNDRARELADSQHRAEARATELHNLNERLQGANEEQRHQREHLDAAYLELQRAHERLETRSSQLSELNEKLRSANAECKLRREELAEVNSRLAEALTRLETRSEHMKDLNEQLRAANEECRAGREDLQRVNGELARANEKLRELEDIRAQFTLLVTHELRAPVAAIQSFLKLILEGYVPEAKVRETLIKAERRAMDQLALIADLLELGRIGSADARGQVQPLQLAVALKEQLDLLSAGARERGITVQTDIGRDLPLVMANPDQVKSLWNNLVSNAIKYNRDNGQVAITLQCEGDRLVASVRDTGIGIPPEAMSRLFSEFFRADNAKAYSRSGTGLGLSIVKEIIERAGGQITVESELGKGTTFRFWLPALREKAPSASEPGSAGREGLPTTG